MRKNFKMHSTVVLAAISALIAGPAAAQQPTSAPETAKTPPVSVTGRPFDFNEVTRYEHSMPEVYGTTLTVTKKSTVVRLDQQPTVIDNNQRAIFNGLPGIVIGEQQNPSQLNISYRGLGNPQESEYVLSLQDGIPIASDWIGFPTHYYLPVPQTLRQVEMIRGGSGLLYGPQPQPVINYISRRPPADRTLGGTSEQVGGSNGLFSTFNAIGGTSGALEYLGDFNYRRSSGQRSNGDYQVQAGDVHLGYQLAPGNKFGLDVHGYSVESGLPGLQTVQQFNTDATITTTPNDRLSVDRTTAVLNNDNAFADGWLFQGKLWTGNQRLTTRNVDRTPATTTLNDQKFDFTGVDARMRLRWGRSNYLTFGYTGYTSSSPWREFDGPKAQVDRNDFGAPLIYANDRHTRYDAVFIENVFRPMPGIHFVPSARFEREVVSAHETAATGHPNNLIDRSWKKTLPLFGFGVGNDFDRINETYLNIAQGYRPVRYLDTASPNRLFASANNPDPTTYLTYEAGVHGWPSAGYFYDISVFQVNTKNKIESQGTGVPGQTVNVNSGNARSRGIEGQIEYDLFKLMATRPAGERLDFSFNASLLDAKITQSTTLVAAGGPTLAGNTPAYAPHYVIKAGLKLSHSDVYKVGLTLLSTGEQYWADNNLPRIVGGVITTPAKIPKVTLADLAFDWTVAPHLRVLGGVTNLTDHKYYSRVFFVNGGIEPAKRRTAQLGAAYDF